MEPVTWVFAVVAAVVVFVMAAVVIGREARRLDAVAPRVVYTIDEAVEFVGDRVPAATQARLTPGELEQLLVFHLRWLHAKGLQPVDVADRRHVDAHLAYFDAIGAVGPQAAGDDITDLDQG
jgi:hypothetical protein